MFIGLPNPNMIAKLEKMSITIQNGKKAGKVIYVLYNPESYQQSRQIGISSQPAPSANMPVVQFKWGTSGILSFQLFFDTMSSGAEIGGKMTDKLEFEANRLLPSAAKLDVRKYTNKIFDLMLIDASTHTPPILKLEWASLQFKGYMVQCKQTFTKFNETGAPVRATLDCVFQEYIEPKKIPAMQPNESPDTTKYRTVIQGDSLWALSAREYGQPDEWRAIADANGLNNPRRLRNGEMLVLPGLD